MTNCICGASAWGPTERELYEVTEAGETKPSGKMLALLRCAKCGTMRQKEPPYHDAASAAKFYATYQPTSAEYKAKSYAHDRELAQKRLKTYGVTPGRVLDIGSGSGAFVDACRGEGLEAYGCELAEYADSGAGKFTYRKNFEDIHFPTDHFPVVTCHDVLEHQVDPVTFLTEAFRVTGEFGHFWLEVPELSDEAPHHCKLEHLWYFTERGLSNVLLKLGYRITGSFRPIVGKRLLHCEKPEQHRTTILLPPGLGDSFWSLTKLRAFCEREKIKGVPEVMIASPREKRFDGHKRAFPFLAMFPFLKSSGETVTSQDATHKAIWNEAYAREGRTIFKDVLGCDYFIAYNGHLRVGKRMEQLDRDLKTEWILPRFVSLEEEQYREQAQEKYGKYAVFYFIFGGTYKYWIQEFPTTQIAEFVNSFTAKSGLIPVFVGAKWDAEDEELRALQRMVPGAIDLVGKTTVEELFGLIRGAELVTGFPSGLTIMSANLGINTLIVWNDYYNRNFAWHCVQAEVKNTTYFIENTKNLTAPSLTRTALGIVKKEPAPAREIVRAHEVATRAKGGVPQALPEVTIACVLKSGGVFDKKYSQILERMLQRHVQVPFRFVVLTDTPYDDSCLPLKEKLPGWWSKLELFNLTGPTLYFDLDTVIVDDITGMVQRVAAMPAGEFRMLKPFNPQRALAGAWASGVMAWNGDFSKVILNNCGRFAREGEWDQVFIFRRLAQAGINILPINDFGGIMSRKRHCLNGVPAGAQVICFHGNEKPHSAPHLSIVKEHWK